MTPKTSHTTHLSFGAERSSNLVAGLTVSFVAISLGAAFGILPLSLASDTACTKTIEEHS